MGPTSRELLPQKLHVVTRRPRKPPGGGLPPPGGCCPPPLPVRLLLGISTCLPRGPFVVQAPPYQKNTPVGGAPPLPRSDCRSVVYRSGTGRDLIPSTTLGERRLQPP